MSPETGVVSCRAWGRPPSTGDSRPLREYGSSRTRKAGASSTQPTARPVVVSGFTSAISTSRVTKPSSKGACAMSRSRPQSRTGTTFERCGFGRSPDLRRSVLASTRAAGCPNRQSSQTMLIRRGPTTHRSADDSPGGCVEVHRHRSPAAAQVPEWP